MDIMKKTYFVYQAWTEETLYRANLTYEEANEAFDTLNNLIESGCCGDGCAVVGNLEEPSDYYVAQRLGLI